VKTIGMAENSIKTTLYTRNIFSPEDADLYELTQLAGVTLDPNVFKIVTDLLKLNAQPASIVKVLKKMSCGGSGNQRRRVRGNSGSSDGSSRKGGSDKSPSGASLGSGEPPRPRLPSQRSASASSLTHAPSVPPRSQALAHAGVTVNGARVS